MMDYRREPHEYENEGNDGYVWSRGLAALVALGLSLAAAFAAFGHWDILGGFIGFSG